MGVDIWGVWCVHLDDWRGGEEQEGGRRGKGVAEVMHDRLEVRRILRDLG